jgi:hypothetical protein
VAAGEISEAERAQCEADELRRCATAYYYSGYEANPLRSCNVGEPLVTIGATLQTVLFRGEDILHKDVAYHTRALQRYFEPHALVFETATTDARYPIRYAMQGSEEELMQALDEAGVPLNRELTAEEEAIAFRVTGEVIFRDFREFLAEFSQQATVGVNIIVIPQIVDPELKPVLDLKGEVVGLGISAALIERVGSEEPGLSFYELFGIDMQFTPTLLVGHRTIVRYLAEPDAVVAHEMGHALGLPHVDAAGNLMQPIADPRCRGGLLQEQVELMGPFQSHVGDPDCGLPNIGQLHSRIVERLLQRRLPSR